MRIKQAMARGAGSLALLALAGCGGGAALEAAPPAVPAPAPAPAVDVTAEAAFSDYWTQARRSALEAAKADYRPPAKPVTTAPADAAASASGDSQAAPADGTTASPAPSPAAPNGSTGTVPTAAPAPVPSPALPAPLADAPPPPADATPQVLAGYLVLLDSVWLANDAAGTPNPQPKPDVGSPCTPSAAPEIDSGVLIEVLGPPSHVVARSRLMPSLWVLLPQGLDEPVPTVACAHPFAVDDVPPQAQYLVRVGDRHSGWIPFAELESNNWLMDFTVKPLPQ